MKTYKEAELSNEDKNLFVKKLRTMVKKGIMECPAQKSYGEFIIYSPNGSIDGVCVFCYNLFGYSTIKEVTEFCPATDYDDFLTYKDPLEIAEQIIATWKPFPIV